MVRISEINRITKETDITVKMDLDGTGSADIATGIGFFDHMLEGFARHGFFDLECRVKGDLAVDGHHTVEDTGIVLGHAIRDMVPLFCLWMMLFACAQLTYAADLIFPMIAVLQPRKSAIWIPSLSVSFSMPYPTAQA